MHSTRPARVAGGAAITAVAAGGLILITGGAALADHVDALVVAVILGLLYLVRTRLRQL